MMKINRYYPFAFVYFFFNIVGLPFGMLYTSLLTPLFYLWLTAIKKKGILLRFFLPILPFVAFHLINGVQIQAYIRSIALLFTVYIFCYSTYILFNRHQGWDKLFSKLLVTNFLFTLVAIILIFTPFKHVLWTFQTMASNLLNVPRLKMLTYEPSYYSTLLVPIYFYFFLSLYSRFTNVNIMHLFMIILPLLLSFSMGVLSCIAISTSIFFIWYAPGILKRKSRFQFFIVLFFSLISAFFFLLIFYPNNPLFIRLNNVLLGIDQSGNGRTLEAFQLAYTIAELKSVWWGVGPGQLKIIGDPIIKSFYNYPESYGTVSIPCASAETIAIFGIFGFIIRIGIQLYLCFKTKVFYNYYQTLLFIYVFIYQFTGSFISNTAEYVIWILAFSNIFPQFDNSRHNEDVHVIQYNDKVI